MAGVRRRLGAACGPVRRSHSSPRGRFARHPSVMQIPVSSVETPNGVRRSFWRPVKVSDLAASVGIQGRPARTIEKVGRRNVNRSVKRCLDRFRSRGRCGGISSGRLRSLSDNVEREIFFLSDGSKKTRGNKFKLQKPPVRLGLRREYVSV